MKDITRRGFLIQAGLASTALMARRVRALAAKSPFRVSVITDEISNDFDHACSIAANEFGLQWVEVRAVWGKYLYTAPDSMVSDALKVLAKYNLRIGDLASPVFKTHWPGAPRLASSEGPSNRPAKPEPDATAVFKQQEEMLEKYIELCKQFKTDKLRIFDFSRIEDQAPYRAAINAKLHDAAGKVGKHDIYLILENEMSCNTATSKECVSVLDAVKSPYFALNWDPGNAVEAGELDAFPNGWNRLPKDRIRHCHVKNAVRLPNGKFLWAPTGTGIIDWVGQFRALAKSGFRGEVSLETHYNGATPEDPTRRLSREEATRESWAGMKKALVDSGNWKA